MKDSNLRPQRSKRCTLSTELMGDISGFDPPEGAEGAEGEIRCSHGGHRVPFRISFLRLQMA